MRSVPDPLLRARVIERGNRKSRFPNPASRIRGVSDLIDKSLSLGRYLVRREGTCVPRGAAWPNVKPALGLELKKQILSDCDLRNLSRADEGAIGGRGTVERIAAEKAIATNL